MPVNNDTTIRSIPSVVVTAEETPPKRLRWNQPDAPAFEKVRKRFPKLDIDDPFAFVRVAEAAADSGDPKELASLLHTVGVKVLQQAQICAREQGWSSEQGGEVIRALKSLWTAVQYHQQAVRDRFVLNRQAAYDRVIELRHSGDELKGPRTETSGEDRKTEYGAEEVYGFTADQFAAYHLEMKPLDALEQCLDDAVTAFQQAVDENRLAAHVIASSEHNTSGRVSGNLDGGRLPFIGRVTGSFAGAIDSSGRSGSESISHSGEAIKVLWKAETALRTLRVDVGDEIEIKAKCSYKTYKKRWLGWSASDYGIDYRALEKIARAPAYLVPGAID